MKSLNETPLIQAQVVSVYVDSLRLVWQVGIAFAAIRFPFTFPIRSWALRNELNTEYGIEEKKAEVVEDVVV